MASRLIILECICIIFFIYFAVESKQNENDILALKNIDSYSKACINCKESSHFGDLKKISHQIQIKYVGRENKNSHKKNKNKSKILKIKI